MVDLRYRVAAVLAVLAVASTLHPLVSGAVWWVELLVTVVVAAAAGQLAARFLAGWLVPVVEVLVLLLTLCLLFAGADNWLWLVPTPTTVLTLAGLVRDGATHSMSFAPPAPDDPGMRLIVVAGLSVVWWVVDVLAAGLRHPALAGLGLLAVYTVPAALAPGGVSWWLFAVAGAGYLVLLGCDGRHRVQAWGRVLSLNRRDGGLRQVIAGSGVALAAAALATAVLAPALLPGLTERPFPTGQAGGDGPGDGSIAVLNPILSMHDDLTSQSETVALEYRTDAAPAEPVRVVTDDVFDGTTWSPTYGELSRRDRVQDGLTAPPGLSSLTPRRELVTDITVGALAQGMLPVPYPATQIDIDGDWLFDRSTLSVFGDQVRTGPGLQYRVRHLALTPSPEQLIAATPSMTMQRWTQLPTGMPAEIRQTALDVAGTGSQYEQALKLQTWLRADGGFRYTLDAPPANSSQAIVDFLQAKAGYCVHFASTMAVMARTLGIPARVAVGFQPGERLGDGRYQVRQRDAHAWPELYFEGAGWVRFEPTPAARAPSLPQWAAPRVDNQPVQPTPTAAPSAATPTAAGAGGDRTPSGVDWAGIWSMVRAVPWRVVAGIWVVVAVLASPALSAWWARRSQRRRAVTVRDHCLAAWEQVLTRLADLGVVVPAAASIRTARRLLVEALPDSAHPALDRLAHDAEAARFAPDVRGPTDAAGRPDGPGGEAAAVATVPKTATLPRTVTLSSAEPWSEVSTVVCAARSRLTARRRWRATVFPDSGVALLRRGLTAVAGILRTGSRQ